jgi:hypothetical protein
MLITKLDKCRFCGKGLKEIYNFGEIYISGFIKPGEKSLKAPLRVVQCKNCGLVQLGDTVDLDYLYKGQYWYTSSLNSSMVASLKDIVNKTEKKIALQKDDVVVDIGCNDNTLFMFYPKDVIRVGYEPSSNLREEGESMCDYFINDYFSADTYPKELSKAKIVTSIAMFYDLPNPGKFIEDIKTILDDNGIWVIQLTDLYSMAKLNEFGSFCHEHLEFYTLTILDYIMKKKDLRIFDLEYNSTNGGSLRLYVCFKNAKYEQCQSVNKALTDERTYFYNNTLEQFFQRIESIRVTIKDYLTAVKRSGKEIYGLGASTKGATLCQYFGLDYRIITSIGEVNADKFGLVTTGTQIPIVPEKNILTEPYINKVIILIIWQFKDTLLPKLSKYLEKGMQILVPLPEPILYTKKGEFKLWT